MLLFALLAACAHDSSRNSLHAPPPRFAIETASGVPGDVLVLGVAARDATRLVAVGGRAETDPGVVLTSADAGRSWSVATHPAPARLYDVAFTDGLSCVAVGLASTIVRSTDGGATWSLVHSAADGWLASVAFADTQRGFAVGHDDGAALVLATTDGGVTWTRDTAASGLAGAATLRGACFADARRGLFVGTEGVVLATDDGGATFVLHDLGDDYLRVVAFDGDEFHVYGDAGAAWRTRRGEFVRGEAPQNDRFNALAFDAHGGAFLAGMSGGSWWRADSEAAWIPTGLDASAAWCGFAFPGQAVVVVGERGRIGRLVRAAADRD